MTIASSTSPTPVDAIPERALRQWAAQRLHHQCRPDGGTVYAFLFSGSTCTNMGRALDVVMTVAVDAGGRIEFASARPAAADTGCNEMCASSADGCGFLKQFGDCNEAIGLTLQEAALRDWDPAPSGCFCTEGDRRHKWRNVFQTLHYAVTHLRR